MIKRLIVVLILLLTALTLGGAKLDSEELFDRCVDDISQGYEQSADCEEIHEIASGVTALSPSELLSSLWTLACEKALAPLRLLCRLLAVTLISSMLTTFFAGGAERQITLAAVLTAVAMCGTELAAGISDAAELIGRGGMLVRSFTPVFAAITTASGAPTSAGAFSVLLLFASQAAIYLSECILLPLLSLCLALTLSEAASPLSCTGEILISLRKCVVWLLGLFMALFIGLLSLQTVVGAAADTLALRAGKFVISSAIPVIGGAAAEAYSTVRGGMEALRGSVGAFGIILLLAELVPPLVTLILYGACFSLSAVLAGLFGASRLRNLFSGISAVYSIAVAVTVAFVLMISISVIVVLRAVG